MVATTVSTWDLKIEEQFYSCYTLAQDIDHILDWRVEYGEYPSPEQFEFAAKRSAVYLNESQILEALSSGYNLSYWFIPGPCSHKYAPTTGEPLSFFIGYKFVDNTRQTASFSYYSMRVEREVFRTMRYKGLLLDSDLVTELRSQGYLADPDPEPLHDIAFWVNETPRALVITSQGRARLEYLQEIGEGGRTAENRLPYTWLNLASLVEENRNKINEFFGDSEISQDFLNTKSDQEVVEFLVSLPNDLIQIFTKPYGLGKGRSGEWVLFSRTQTDKSMLASIRIASLVDKWKANN